MMYKLSPSDFAFLYEGCKRCFYLKVNHGIAQPTMPLPGIFTIIASLLKTHYTGKSTKELHPSFPAGIVNYGERFVRSMPIQINGRRSTCFINGRFDIVVEFKDKTFGVIDFKTGTPKDAYSSLYGRQLHAYAYALENPAPGALKLAPVTWLGLLYFPPIRTLQNGDIGKLLYEAEIHWVKTERDDNNFLNFIDEVLTFLENPTPPEPSQNCNWCNYVKTVHIKNLLIDKNNVSRLEPSDPF